MGYRRLFIMRKDLEMSPGKLAAQVAHCAEAYWTNFIRDHSDFIDCSDDYRCSARILGGIFDNYINGAFVKTICEAKNKIIYSRPRLRQKSWVSQMARISA